MIKAILAALAISMADGIVTALVILAAIYQWG